MVPIILFHNPCNPCNLWFIFLFYGYRLYLCQQLPEFAIVYLDPAIQVKADPLVSVVAQFFIKGLEFGLLFDELVPSPSILLRWAEKAWVSGLHISQTSKFMQILEQIVTRPKLL